MNAPRGTISFRCFGVPVYITPLSWLFLAILGGGLHMREAGQMPAILIFVVVGMVVLLTHEFGHALAGRALGGTPHAIVVEGFGAATHSTPPQTRWGYFLMVLAGPLATLLPALVGGVAFALQTGINPLSGVVFAFMAPLPFVDLPFWVQMDLWSLNGNLPSDFVLTFYDTLFGVSVWWCLFNLLPVFPLDGGQLLSTLCPNKFVVCGTGLLLSLGMVAWAVSIGSVFLIILFAYFALINWRILRDGGGR